MNVLVTGGAGFIGSYVVRDLAALGHDVVVYDLRPKSELLKKIIPPGQQKTIQFETGEITDQEAIVRVLKTHDIAFVVHLAYMLMEASELNPALAVRVNGQGMTCLFEACLHQGVRRVVWGSSVAVFGDTDEYEQEILSGDAAYRPHTIYGICKVFNEFLAKYYQQKGLPNVGLRFNLVYGPGRSLVHGTGAGFVSELIEKSALSEEWSSIPYGDDAMNWLYVEDAARAVGLALREESRCGIYTICGEYRSLRDVASLVKKIIPGANIRLQPGRYGFSWKHDMKEALEAIGYWPQYSLEEGVSKNIDYVRRS
ncbi:MAG: NAD(P)-dependent oxidoreductase [Thermodesulfobacteriota bacterium]